jgi:hypothetical protein
MNNIVARTYSCSIPVTMTALPASIGVLLALLMFGWCHGAMVVFRFLRVRMRPMHTYAKVMGQKIIL